MKCNSTNPQKYKKPTFLRRIINFFKIPKEMYLTDEEAEHIDKDFDKMGFKNRKGKRKWFVKR